MNKFGLGVRDNSEIYFSSPSQKAKSLYYHVLCAGHFFCDKDYHIARDNYDSVLILHVIDGSLTFKDKNSDLETAVKNDTVILDCYDAHEYYTTNFIESLWIHIAGVNAREICNEIIKTKGHVLKGSDSKNIKKRILRLTDGIRIENMVESNISLEVYKLFLEFLTPSDVKIADENVHEDTIRSIKEYILCNLQEKISVEILCEKAHMSPTHFTRLFKKETGFSPYNYVLSARLSRAKELLLKTDKSVAEIAYETGFNSEANFIYCFKNSEGISPGKFRKIAF